MYVKIEGTTIKEDGKVFTFYKEDGTEYEYQDDDGAGMRRLIDFGAFMDDWLCGCWSVVCGDCECVPRRPEDGECPKCRSGWQASQFIERFIKQLVKD
jgi:hypothetical protein